MPNPYEKYLSVEDKLQRAVNKYLDLKKLLYFHPYNEGNRTPFERFKATVLGIKAGVPDTIILEPRGRFVGLAIELKAEYDTGLKKDGSQRKKRRGTVSFEQQVWLDKMKKRRWSTHVAYNLDEAINIIDTYLALDINVNN